MTDKDINGSRLIPDELWQQIEPLLPPVPARLRMDYPHIEDRRIMEAVFCVLRKGHKWEELPDNSGAGDMIYVRFKEWWKIGVFDRMWQVGILTQDEFWTLIRHGKRINIADNRKD